MRVIFDEELRQVADDLDQMARNVQTAVRNAGKALFDCDVETAQSVIDGDLDIDALETSVVEQSIQLLAKQNPVATDLRVVVSSLRLASTLERMGDLARHLAEIARRTYPASAVTPQSRELFLQMQEFIESATSEVVTMLTDRDQKLAQQIIIDDDKLDDLHAKVYELIVSDEWEGTSQQTVDAALLSRFYERIGDHAVSVARRVTYIVSGFNPSKDPASLGKDPD